MISEERCFLVNSLDALLASWTDISSSSSTVSAGLAIQAVVHASLAFDQVIIASSSPGRSEKIP